MSLHLLMITPDMSQHSKSEVLSKFVEYVTMMENETDLRV